MAIITTQGTATSLLKEVKTLVDADLELTGEIGGRFYHGRARNEPAFPYILVEHFGSDEQKYVAGVEANHKLQSVSLQFSCFTLDADELAESITQLLWEVIEAGIPTVSWADGDGIVKKAELTQAIVLEEPDRDDVSNKTVWRSSIFVSFLVQVRR